MKKGPLGLDGPMNGGSLPNKGCAGSNISKGGGHPKPKTPALSLRKFIMMVSLFLSMMALTMVAFPS